eukprot:GHVT01066420.1.p1 GENE.GHVT01066420.1~~GHVT01066420.1.p1  ORF type:complete len:183 (+),score=36.70 GHVT01066420.1:553-1101(+)
MSTVAFSNDSAPLQPGRKAGQALRGSGKRPAVGSKHLQPFSLSQAALALSCVGIAVGCLFMASSKGLLHDGGASRKGNKGQVVRPSHAPLPLAPPDAKPLLISSLSGGEAPTEEHSTVPAQLRKDWEECLQEIAALKQKSSRRLGGNDSTETKSDSSACDRLLVRAISQLETSKSDTVPKRS